ncbi:cytochrome c [Mariniphaga sediminis]|jgi:mono/diheme cytochrome c family protein|uniref:Cytochrome c n=1 Tax=Mariniphaga sediminis TaxID=1628158 RepID=A0A399D0U7_9BACT|nr:cytochrome c [Mariniphaga sediminis]RIH65484.1 cytochrome c [Mariniphaga sediminis]
MKFNVILSTLLIILLSACGGQEKNEDEQQQSPNQTQTDSPKSATMANHPGKKVYDAVCLACHMADGSGVPGMFPPLAQTDWVLEDKERLIHITLEGLSGKIVVNGEEYNSIMPPNSHLSDKQIADVLTYIRQSFGNDASEITIEEVQKVRNR